MQEARYKVNSKAGLTLVEVVIASAIILTAVLALLAVHNLYLRVAFSNASAVKGAYLLEEGLEAVRYLRDRSWDEYIATLSTNTSYGIVFVEEEWQATTTDTYIDNFERTIILEDVMRNAEGDIVEEGGALDPNTLKVTGVVSWSSGTGTTTKSIATYLTNLYGN